MGPIKRVSGDEDCLYLNVYVPKAGNHHTKAELLKSTFLANGFLTNLNMCRKFEPY